MVETKIIHGDSGAHQYQLMIKNILEAGLRYEPQREIVY